MLKTKLMVAAMSTALVISGGVAYAAVAASSPTGPTAVSKLCKKGTTSVYSKASCRTGDQAITLKGLVGPAGEAGPAGLPGAKGDTGPAGPAGEAAGLVRRCVSTVIDSDFVSLDQAGRTVKITGLPPYTDIADLGATGAVSDVQVEPGSSNVTAVADHLGTGAPLKITAGEPSGVLGSGTTTRSFVIGNVTGAASGITGVSDGEAETLKICVIRQSV